MGRRFVFIEKKGVAYDADAQAFLTATGITDLTISNAINNLVIDLKNDGIWSKMKAIYPFVGGTATTHKYNLKDPRDLDVAFRLLYSGTLTHSSNGVVSDGSSGVIDTRMNALSELVNSNLSLSFYSRTNTTTNAFSNEITPNSLVYTSANWITFRINNKSTGNAYFSAGNDNVPATVSSTLGNGFFIGNETANNSRKLIRNNVVLATNTTTDNNALPNINIALFGTTGGNISTNQCAFASLGQSLTDTELTDYNTAVQTFQTALSRNV